MAYEILSCLICLYVAVTGSIAWMNLCKGCDFKDIEEDRFYGHSDYFERHLAAPLLSYQFWNFCNIVNLGRNA